MAKVGLDLQDPSNVYDFWMYSLRYKRMFPIEILFKVILNRTHVQNIVQRLIHGLYIQQNIQLKTDEHESW